MVTYFTRRNNVFVQLFNSAYLEIIINYYLQSIWCYIIEFPEEWASWSPLSRSPFSSAPSCSVRSVMAHPGGLWTNQTRYHMGCFKSAWNSKTNGNVRNIRQTFGVSIHSILNCLCECIMYVYWNLYFATMTESWQSLCETHWLFHDPCVHFLRETKITGQHLVFWAGNKVTMEQTLGGH